MKLFVTLMAVCGSVAWPCFGRAAERGPLPGDEPRLLRHRGQGNWVNALAFSPDGRTLATADTDGTVRLWDPRTGNLLCCLAKVSGPAYALAFSPDGEVLASAGEDSAITLTPMVLGKQPRSLKGHTDTVTSLAFSPDGKLLASGSYDQTVRLWNLSDGTCAFTLQGHAGRVTSVAFSPDGRMLASGSVIARRVGPVVDFGQSDTVLFWDPATGSLARKTDLKGMTVAFHPQRPILATGGGHPYVRPYPTGGMAIGGINVIRTTDADSDVELAALKWRGEAAAWSPDGRLLVTTLGDTTHVPGSQIFGGFEGDKLPGVRLRLWDAVGRKEILSLSAQALVRGPEFAPPPLIILAAFSPDGRTLAATTDGWVLVWDLTALAADRELLRAGLDSGTLGRIWEDLAGADGPVAFRAVCTLASAPREATAYLRERLRPASNADGERFRRLLADLDHPNFHVREAAHRDIKPLAVVGEPALRAALGGPGSAEMRWRVQALLDEVNRSQLGADVRRSDRAVHTLELIGSQASWELLAELARGDDYAALTHAARRALQRKEGRDRLTDLARPGHLRPVSNERN